MSEADDGAFDEFESGLLSRAADRARLLGIALVIFAALLGLLAAGAGAAMLGSSLSALGAMIGIFYLIPAVISGVVGALYVASASWLKRVVVGDADARTGTVSAARLLGAAFLVQVALILLLTVPTLIALIVGLVAGVRS